LCDVGRVAGKHCFKLLSFFTFIYGIHLSINGTQCIQLGTYIPRVYNWYTTRIHLVSFLKAVYTTILHLRFLNITFSYCVSRLRMLARG